MRKNLLRKAFSPVINAVRKVYYPCLDFFESLFGLRDELTPPRNMMFVGKGNFKKIGDEFVQYFIDKAGLKKTDSVLDIGCGIGRMAIPLTKYLSKEGSYEGMDIVAKGIDWCSQKITPRYPNFRFQLSDVYSELYNPGGRFKSTEYKFPYDDKLFDFIFLTSVFTHVMPDEVENYLSEIARVLKPGGTCFITFFLLNEDSLNHVDKKLSSFSFSHRYGNYSIEDESAPLYAVAYQENFIRNLYYKFGLKIKQPVYYGSWCGRKIFLDLQDIVIANK